MIGQYIWRTVGDLGVRKGHAARNGKTFSWDDPPEGGHPGEEYNCRCWAEPVKVAKGSSKNQLCLDIWKSREKVQRKHEDFIEKIRKTEKEIHLRNTQIEDLKQKIRDLGGPSIQGQIKKKIHIIVALIDSVVSIYNQKKVLDYVYGIIEHEEQIEVLEKELETQSKEKEANLEKLRRLEEEYKVRECRIFHP